MITPLPKRNLLHNKMHTMAAIAAVSFAITLIFFQFGLYQAILSDATRIYDQLLFDVVLVSHRYLYTGDTGVLPRKRMYQCYIPGTKKVFPFYMNIYRRRNEKTRLNWPILIMAFRPEDQVFKTKTIEKNRSLLKKTETVLLDRLYLPHCGKYYIGHYAEIEKKDLASLVIIA